MGGKKSDPIMGATDNPSTNGRERCGRDLEILAADAEFG
jgi:hypothetical protein